MKRHICLLTGFVLLLSGLSAQDLNGIWKGKLVMEPGGCFPVYNIELQLQVAGTKITGVSYHFSDTSNYVKETFDGRYVKDSNMILIGELGVTTFHIPADCVPCIKKYNLTYHKGDGPEEQLRGSWSGKTMDGKSNCPPGTIVLQRFDKSSFKPESKLPPTLTKRKAELVREIKVDTGVIHIDFYDNGQIDGDTISVYVNNMPTVSYKRLTAKPISISVKIDPKRTEQEVIMVGENLGEIPPNTALMIINAGEKRYQLYLTSDETKNAMVRFIYEKPAETKL
ncbi:MAG: hypothetical protein IPP93_03980 [Chitinophagaceae bacterium]|nr:hypothetical protein [Chitinophagaceae bacterium]MBL0334337.1 hypothetical protein [Chitinophagaceae bacterium]